MTQGDPLFDRVVQLCGFSAYVGPGAVRRSLAEVGSPDRGAGTNDYRRALPALQRRLEVYLSEDDASARIAKIGRFLDDVDRGRATVAVAKSEEYGDDETKWGKRRFGKSVKILQEARDGLDPDEEG